MSCAVFLNGDYEDEAFYRARYEAAQGVVAVDGGHHFLRRLGLWPDVLVGDFDSLDPPLVDDAMAAGVEVVRHPQRKDETDAELAVALAERRWTGGLELLGALGGSFDHALGHVCVLRGLAERGRAARLASPSLAATVVVAPAELSLTSPIGTRVSLVALDAAVVISLRGFDYEVTGERLSASSCRGLGNRIVQARPRVALTSGVLFVASGDGDETFGGQRPAPEVPQAQPSDRDVGEGRP